MLKIEPDYYEKMSLEDQWEWHNMNNRINDKWINFIAKEKAQKILLILQEKYATNWKNKTS